MEKPQCYIPIRLRGYYQKYSPQELLSDKNKAVAGILSVYLDYRCLPTDFNDQEPDDPAGLGILEMICLKLICNPRHTARMRDVYSRLDELYVQIVEKGVSIDKVMGKTFTLEELVEYGL